MRYSHEFKNSVLVKLLPPMSQSVAAVASDTGVTVQIIMNRLSRYNDGKMTIETDGIEPNPSHCGDREKFRLLVEGMRLDDEKLGDWLRKNGLHTEHLTLWEQELEGIVMDKQEELRRKNKELEKENRRLKRETRRNEKAMAEALALLTLKKSGEIIRLGRGRLIAPEKKELLVKYILETVVDEARAKNADKTVCISYRSFLRWKSGKIHVRCKGAVKHIPRKLIKQEQELFYSQAVTNGSAI